MATENRCIIIIRFCSLIKCCYCCSLCSTLFSAFFLVALLGLSIVVLVKCNQARDHTIFLHKRQFIISNIGYCFSFKSDGSNVHCFRYTSKRQTNGCKNHITTDTTQLLHYTHKAMYVQYRASLKWKETKSALVRKKSMHAEKGTLYRYMVWFFVTEFPFSETGIIAHWKSKSTEIYPSTVFRCVRSSLTLTERTHRLSESIGHSSSIGVSVSVCLGSARCYCISFSQWHFQLTQVRK